MLSAARALIGLGVSAGLMGSIKAFTLWFPRDRLTALTGWMIGVGSIGALSATAPAEALLGPFGWRALFFGLGALSLAAALLIFFVVPERELPGEREAWREQFRRVGRIFARWISGASRCRWSSARPPTRRCRASGSRPGSPTCTAWIAARSPTICSGRRSPTWSRHSRSAGRRLAQRGVGPLRVYQAGMLSCAAAFAAARFWRGLGVVLSGAVRGDQHRRDHRLHAADAAGAASADRARDDRVERDAVRPSFAVQWGVGAVLGLWPSAEAATIPEATAWPSGTAGSAGRGCGLAADRARSAPLALLVDDFLRAAFAGADDLALGLLVGVDDVERELVDAVFLDLRLDLGLQLAAVLLLRQRRPRDAKPSTTAAAISFIMFSPLCWNRGTYYYSIQYRAAEPPESVANSATRP